MTTSAVRFAPEALEQLTDLERYIADVSSPRVAARYVDGIVEYCESLQTFPHRGQQRDDIRPGLRLTNFRGRTVIAFVVEDDQPVIVGVYYGGQNVETALAAVANDPFLSFELGLDDVLWRESTQRP
jgi:toxin ParE1/3/4